MLKFNFSLSFYLFSNYRPQSQALWKRDKLHNFQLADTQSEFEYYFFALRNMGVNFHSCKIILLRLHGLTDMNILPILINANPWISEVSGVGWGILLYKDFA